MEVIAENSCSWVAINLQKRYITFRDCQVVVCSDLPEVLAGVERTFQAMLAVEPKGLVAQLEVYWQNGEYHLLGSSEVNVISGSLEDVLCSLKYEVVMRLINARPDLLWLHAGAAAYQGGAVVISGLSGRGKSTLITSLCSRGWKYLSDDVLPLEQNPGKVMPFPRTPVVRKNIGEELPSDKVQELSKTEIELKPEDVCPEAMPIKALIFPTYNLNQLTQLLPYSRANAALELLQNCLNFPDHKQTAVSYVCQLVKSLPTFSLSYNDGDLAAELIQQTYEKDLCHD